MELSTFFAILGKRWPEHRRVTLSFSAKDVSVYNPQSMIKDVLPCLATAAQQRWKGRESGQKVGRAAAIRMIAADNLVLMSFYSVGAMLNNVTSAYEPLFFNASNGRCVCKASSLSHATLQREGCIRMFTPIHS